MSNKKEQAFLNTSGNGLVVDLDEESLKLFKSDPKFAQKLLESFDKQFDIKKLDYIALLIQMVRFSISVQSHQLNYQ